MALATGFKSIKDAFRAVVGDFSPNADVRRHVDDLASQVVLHEFDPQEIAAAGATADQAVAAKAFFVASRHCKVDEAFLFLRAPATLSATDNFSVLITKTGSSTGSAPNGSATLTSSHSLTGFVAGITATSATAHPSLSHTTSGIKMNLANVGNRMHLAAVSNRYLAPGDVLRVQVVKGGAGAVFPGGAIQLRVTQGEAS